MATLQNTDKIIVNRDDETYYITFGELRDAIKATNGSYSLEVKSLLKTVDDVKDDDVFLVERAGDPYTVTYQEIVNSINPPIPPIIDTVTLTETTPGANPRFTNQ